MHTPRRVLLLDHSGQVSGAEKSLIAFLEAAGRQRFRYAVACPLPSTLGDALVAIPVDTFPLRFGRPHRRLSPRTLFEAAGVLRAAGRLRRILNDFAPDIIDANTTNSALHAALARCCTPSPIVWHVRDLVTPGRAERFIAKRAGAIVAVSEAVRATLVAADIDASKIHVIHNGIDPDRFRPTVIPAELRRNFDLPPDAPLVGVVGQLTRWKGHDVLLHAWVRVRQHNPRAILLVVGSPHWPEDQNWSQTLKTLAGDLALADSVRFIPRQDDVASIVGALDLLVVPSHAEPFGRVALEAMALAKPVVGTNAGGLPEIVTDNETGLLVLPGDAARLVQAIECVLADHELASRLGRAGADRVRQSFHIDRTARLTQELYDRLSPQGERS